jgi:hypothetical protein
VPYTERKTSGSPLEGGSRDKGFSEVTGGRAPSFPDLSVGEALAPAPQERENSGGGKFPSQISHRKDQPGSLGTKEKPLSREQYSLAIQRFPFSPQTLEPFRLLDQRWRLQSELRVRCFQFQGPPDPED